MLTTRELRSAATSGFIPASGTIAASAGRGDVVLFAASVPAQRGTYRLRVGVTFAALEKRAHGTPTRRCSAGHWASVARYSRGLSFAAILRRAVAALADASGAGAAAGTFQGVVGYARGGAGGCHTLAHSNAATPTLGTGSAGRGRVGRSLPLREPTWGYTPATGRNVQTHSPGRIRAAVARERARQASADYRNNRGSK